MLFIACSKRATTQESNFDTRRGWTVKCLNANIFVQAKMRILIISGLFLFFLGCGGGSDVSPSAPQITNLKVEPQTICVGSTATISFTLVDANDDEIIWGAGLSTGEHGGVNPSIGNVPSGTTVRTNFDAATSGRHNHQVLLRIVATDIGGLQGESSEIELFVFNC